MHDKIKIKLHLTDRLHVFIEVVAGDHLPRPNELFNHLCSLSDALSRRSVNWFRPSSPASDASEAL